VPATVDIDVTPSHDRKNLERLADSFDELEAGLYSVDDGATWFPRRPVENWAQYASPAPDDQVRAGRHRLSTRWGGERFCRRPPKRREIHARRRARTRDRYCNMGRLKTGSGPIEHLDQYFQNLDS
jgi:hypothetical protein